MSSGATVHPNSCTPFRLFVVVQLVIFASITRHHERGAATGDIGFENYTVQYATELTNRNESITSSATINRRRLEGHREHTTSESYH